MRKPNARPLPSPALQPLAFHPADLRALAALWLRRLATRRRLAELDARELADIGRTEAERQRECAKWFWEG